MSTATTRAVDLPPEILHQISLNLTQHDRTVSVRVCKTWQKWFTPSLWHTVDFKESLFWRSDQLDRLNALVGDLDAQESTHAEASAELTPEAAVAAKIARQGFIRNLGYIRVLRIQHAAHWNLFLDPHGSLNQSKKLDLQELSANFQGPKATDAVEPLIQLLLRSGQLRTLSMQTNYLTPEATERLFAVLPQSLESLTFISQHNIADGEQRPEQDEEARKASLERIAKLPTSGNLDQLKVLSVTGLQMSMTALMALLKRCPALEELDISGVVEGVEDSRLEEIVSKGSAKGWKTLGFKDTWASLGPKTVTAILHHAGTLENFRLCHCAAFPSSMIQKLLCSAPKLKRFDMIPSTILDDIEQRFLMADDIINSDQEWACLELETFKCMIAGIPRPDVEEKSNGRPLTDHPLHDPEQVTMERSRGVQRRVLAQLGRLTKLREITLGVDVLEEDHIGDHELHSEEQELEGDYYDEDDVQLGKQYRCLSMSLENGLDLLENLKCLQRLHIEKMSTNVEEEEQEWMRENWPVYRRKSRDTFWTSRGHQVGEFTDDSLEIMEDVGEDDDCNDATENYGEEERFDWW
ncbi:hypothetical protein EMPS_04468 [Entomortierella parvispora]|uniref:F-box domain-containing protein n=1 Tax=Entomortierella parvispora TaxID=205924 RepID=A0A9P3H8I9_9FUNG|nr:hypothetical protein EMPS_04468 [Entomortierella parvispora]